MSNIIYNHVAHNAAPPKTERSYALAHESDILLVCFSSNLSKVNSKKYTFELQGGIENVSLSSKCQKTPGKF